jgi:hypothetical protein
MYNVILQSPPPRDSSKLYNPNATLATIEKDCKVYCFVMGRTDLPDDFNNDLKNLGLEYENNLYVGMWNMGDDNYEIIVDRYNLRKLPCVVMTGLDTVSSIGDDQYLYVRLGGRILETEHLNDTKGLIRELYNLIIAGELQQAVKEAKHKGISLFLADLARRLGKFSEKFLRLLSDLGLTVEYGGAKVTLGKSGGDGGENKG